MAEEKTKGQSSKEATKEKKIKYPYQEGKGLPPLNLYLHWCKACNICIAFCPLDVFDPDRDGKPILARPEQCSQCAICWLHCPDFVITSNYK
ncbi:MAG: 4Fe-4S dicluster domain-containing protein [candidate division Zixibacteria bacterium]